ncbi:MAG: DUF1848 domain-containing protein [Planctomycetes bacterium]|nr:DUF1848 domain-containing protein [Planctomycetota bacterium]
MKQIISVSRRTDVPAFYGPWFMGRVREGYAGVVHPFGGKRYVVSLRREDVTCFVFWSKDFTPFVEDIETLDRLGYRFYFNYTVTAAPTVFESCVDKAAALRTLKLLSRRYSPSHINWRFDPIVLSSVCDGEFYLREFERLAHELEGLVERCYFSFVMPYRKVDRNFGVLEQTEGLRIIHASESERIDLAHQLAATAGSHGITMHSCCGEYLLADETIQRAHCIDGSLIERLFYPQGLAWSEKPTREGCGCAESIDIGTYDTCPHGCVYCYANANKAVARRAFEEHDPASAFLGFPKAQSDEWLHELKQERLC